MTGERTKDAASVEVGREPAFSWWRVLAVVAAVAALGSLVLTLGLPLLEPAEPYGTGVITIGAVSTEAEVCESIEHGIEVATGELVMHVRHMGPDGSFIVHVVNGGEQWSEPGEVRWSDDGTTTIIASFGDETPVGVTYGSSGWCRGADPNVFGR